jgi:hypothetical protein
MTERRPVTGEIYKHFKNKLYQIVAIAQHSETKEELVIYQALYGDFGVYARPLEMFVSEVDHVKYPEVKQKYRFEKQEKESLSDNGTSKIEECVEKEVVIKMEDACKKDDAPVDINDKMMAFFDTEDLEQRYKILSSMREEITDGMIDNMAVVMDIVIPDGPTINRYDDLKRAIATKQRYEQNKRLR